jgi:hypothetical protein
MNIITKLYDNISIVYDNDSYIITYEREPRIKKIKTSLNYLDTDESGVNYSDEVIL